MFLRHALISHEKVTSPRAPSLARALSQEVQIFAELYAFPTYAGNIFVPVHEAELEVRSYMLICCRIIH